MKLKKVSFFIIIVLLLTFKVFPNVYKRSDHTGIYLGYSTGLGGEGFEYYSGRYGYNFKTGLNFGAYYQLIIQRYIGVSLELSNQSGKSEEWHSFYDNEWSETIEKKKFNIWELSANISYFFLRNNSFFAFGELGLGYRFDHKTTIGKSAIGVLIPISNSINIKIKGIFDFAGGLGDNTARLSPSLGLKAGIDISL